MAHIRLLSWVGHISSHLPAWKLVPLEVFCLLRYNAMYFVEDQPMLQKKISPSALKNKPSKKPAVNMGTLCSSETSLVFNGIHGIIS
jgi:hypothetical protein